MPEPHDLPVTPARKASFLRGLMALFAPNQLAGPLAQADHDLEVSRNISLREASPDRQLESLQAARELTIARLRRLRRALLGSVASMLSATFVAWAFRATAIAPMLPRPVLAVGSILCFAVATLGRLGWGSQSFKGDTSVERLDQRLFHVLFWIGMCWGALAIL